MSRRERFQFIQEATGEVELSENIFNDSNSLFTIIRKKRSIINLFENCSKGQSDDSHNLAISSLEK